MDGGAAGRASAGAQPLDAPAMSPLEASLFESSLDCLKLIDLQGRLKAMNVNGLCLMEIDDFEALRDRPWHELWPEDLQPTVRDAVTRAAAGEVARFSAVCPTAKGTVKQWEVLVTPVLDDTGIASRLISVSQDVTAQVAARANASLLTRELAHRIKNIFAVVDGVIALTAKGDAAAGRFAEGLRERIRGLARATAYVAPAAEPANDPTRHTLASLLRVLLEPYGGEARLQIVGDDLPIGDGAVTALALIFTELGTNAMKYGALRPDAGGAVDVGITLEERGVSVTWEEHAGAASFPQVGAPGFGSVLLDDTARRLLGGRLEREWRQDGLRVSLHIPVERLA